MTADNKMRYRYFFLSFAVAFLVLSCLFLLLMNAVHPKAVALEVEPAYGDGATAYVPSREEALSVLFVGVSADSAQAGTFVLARFDPARGAVPIVCFPAQTAVRNGDKTESLARVYQYGGADYARKALAATLGISIDRYVRMDRNGFLVAAATVGTVEFELDHTIRLAQAEGVTLTLSPGLQLLDGKKVAEIIRYNGYEGGELARCATVGALSAAIVNQRMDIALSTVVDKVFEKIVNLVETDISYPDYDDRKQAARFLAQLGREPAKAIPVAGAFNEDESLYTLTDTFVAALIQTFG